MLTEAEVADVRRFLGYPALGALRGLQPGAWTTRASDVVDGRLAVLTGVEAEVLQGYLRTLVALEAAIPEAATGLDTASAAGWVRNPAEIAERERLFDGWRRRMAGFLGVPPGPGLQRGGVTLVV